MKGNYAVTCFLKRNKKLCMQCYIFALFRKDTFGCIIHERLTTSEEGVARLRSQNGLRKRELGQGKRIPRQQGITQIRVNYFNKYRIARVKKKYPFLLEARLEIT